MATDCIAQVTFQGDGFAKPVVARFDRPNASTDGGLVLFKALDTALGLTQRLAACLEDAREPGKVQHETIELLQQRVFGLCGGYADCNDAAQPEDALLEQLDRLVLDRSEEHTSELQSRQYLVCRLLLEKKNRDSGER